LHHGVRSQEALEVHEDEDDLPGLAEVVRAFMRCKDPQAAKRCVRVYVRRDPRGAPIVVFGWAPS
jgi:hypothetical protein